MYENRMECCPDYILGFSPLDFNKPAKQSRKGNNGDASIQITNFLKIKKRFENQQMDGIRSTPESLTYYFNLRTWKINHIWIHSIVHVKKNIYLFNCYDVSFLELLWYYAKLTYLHTYLFFGNDEPDFLNLRKDSDIAQKMIRIFIIRYFRGYQNKNSQIDFWAESDTKISGSIL